MNADQALGIIDQLLQTQDKSLSRIQEAVFNAAWQEKTYQEIADQIGYDGDYIREIGAELWKILSLALGTRVSKKNLISVLRRYQPEIAVSKNSVNPPVRPKIYQDWGDAEDVSIFFGRLIELSILEKWILADRVRAIAILGMEGIGKSAFAITLAEEIQTNFSHIIWRRAASSPLETLCTLLESLGSESIPNSINQALSQLIDYLRRQRCLIILDQVETVLLPSPNLQPTEYGEIFRRIAATQHQSCLIVVSRIQPREFVLLEGEKVRSHYLGGLSVDEGRELIQARGKFVATESELQSLVQAYDGNPMILNVVATVAEKFFNRQLAPILNLFEQEQWLPESIIQLLDCQFQSLSANEQQVMKWLSEIETFPILSDLMPSSSPIKSGYELLKTLETLQQQCLIEREGNGWRIPSVFKTYLQRIKN
jgi:NB-ARC domain